MAKASARMVAANLRMVACACAVVLLFARRGRAAREFVLYLAARLFSYLGLSRIRVVIVHAGRHGVSFAIYLSSCAAGSLYVL